MNALLLTEYKKLELTQMPVPDIGADDLLVRVKACGICGSDVHGFDGSTGRRIPPIVMGHEASGVVAEVGAGVKRFRAGDRVTFDSTIFCGKCFFCATTARCWASRRVSTAVTAPSPSTWRCRNTSASTCRMRSPSSTPP